MRLILGLLFGLALAALTPPSHAAESSLPVPRFVSLRSDEVNVRTGPGVRYPIDWYSCARPCRSRSWPRSRLGAKCARSTAPRAGCIRAC
ncbi:MAG: hypothetical protein WDO24_26590 [Pseudomonadota bacterium]